MKKSAFRPAVLALLLASVGVGFTAMSAWQQMHRVEVENSQLAEQRQQQLEANKAISQKVQAQDNQLNALIERSRSPMGAMQSLYALWGYQASIVNSDCQSALERHFIAIEQCLFRAGNCFQSPCGTNPLSRGAAILCRV